MLLTITTTHAPATDLGYLLHKNPARIQSFALSFGRAHVFYPEVGPQRCTAALLLEVDPIELAVDQYVNDRPYVASSFLSVAIATVFGTAMTGRSKERPELAAQPLPLEARVAVLPAHGGEPLLRRLFEPLGYTVTVVPHALDAKNADWGDSRYVTVTLAGETRLCDLLNHLYVLVPVLDNDKHYWVGDAEVEKLLRHGEGWLATHPERELVAGRYLKNQRSLVRDALSRLVEEDVGERDAARAQQEAMLEERLTLNDHRFGAVLAVLKESGARRVLDLGCGDGKLLRALLAEKSFEKIVGVDVSHRMLETARDRLRLDRLPELQKKRIELLHASLVYRDKRLAGFDAAAVVEVIEHLDEPRLEAFERVVFEFAQPRTVVVTTPNSEYNVRFEGLPAGRFRHKDHRFEWTRAQFRAWADGIGARYSCKVRHLPVGPEDREFGAPTQMAVFQK